MTFNYVPQTFLLLGLLVLLARLLTILLHELGHAIPIVLLTKERVKVYIGSYGDPRGSGRIRLGLMEIWIRYNPFHWIGGLCISEAKDIPVRKSIIILLAGPLVSVIIAVTASWLTFSYDVHGFLKLICFVFAGFSIFDLAINLVPRKFTVRFPDETEMMNDGYQLKMLLRYNRMPQQLDLAVELYNNGQYEKAAEWMDYFLASEWREPEIYDMAISVNVKLERYEKAEQYARELVLKFPERAEGYYWSGLLNLFCNEYEQSLADFSKSFEIDPLNMYALTNRAFVLSVLGRYEEVLTDIELAFLHEMKSSYHYALKGLAKIKTGSIEAGLQDLNHAIELDPDESYAYRNLGIHHLENGDRSRALELFVKAKELEPATHLIEQLISKAS